MVFFVVLFVFLRSISFSGSLLSFLLTFGFYLVKSLQKVVGWLSPRFFFFSFLFFCLLSFSLFIKSFGNEFCLGMVPCSDNLPYWDRVSSRIQKVLVFRLIKV